MASSCNIKELGSCNPKELAGCCATEETKAEIRNHHVFSLPSVSRAVNGRSSLMRCTPEHLTVRPVFPAKVVCQSDERSKVNFAKLIISGRL